jgi:ribosomal protein L29|tara:strand:- start:291 stop:506 length:216 start_codon:yes stop_codon:yes gene_type:complete
MKVHKSSTELQEEIDKLKQQVEGYEALLDLYKKQLWDLRMVSSENEKHINLMQGYKNVIETLSMKLLKKDK